MGARSVRRLLERIEARGRPPQREMLGAELVVRIFDRPRPASAVETNTKGANL